MSRKTAPFLTRDDCLTCKSCNESLPITEYYLTKASSRRWNKYKRRLGTCKMCTDSKNACYRPRYIHKPEVKIQRAKYLRELRLAPGRCIQCTVRCKLNSSKQCKPCYIKFWLRQAWMKIQKSKWFAVITYEQQFEMAKSFQYAISIVGQADIANKTYMNHWPNEGLYQIQQPSKNPSMAFKLDNIKWRTKKCLE